MDYEQVTGRHGSSRALRHVESSKSRAELFTNRVDLKVSIGSHAGTPPLKIPIAGWFFSWKIS